MRIPPKTNPKRKRGHPHQIWPLDVAENISLCAMVILPMESPEAKQTFEGKKHLPIAICWPFVAYAPLKKICFGKCTKKYPFQIWWSSSFLGIHFFVSWQCMLSPLENGVFFEWIDPPGASLSRRSPVEGEEDMKSGND